MRWKHFLLKIQIVSQNVKCVISMDFIVYCKKLIFGRPRRNTKKYNGFVMFLGRNRGNADFNPGNAILAKWEFTDSIELYRTQG